MKKQCNKADAIAYRGRRRVVLATMFLGLGLLATRAGHLQLVDNDYLQQQGKARYERVIKTAPTRGLILDRNGEPLAVSTPVDSVWAHPPTLLAEGHSWKRLARLMKMPVKKLRQLVRKNQAREFVYLKRHLSPAVARSVIALDIPGVEIQREYRRYYPSGPVFGQVLGFTDIDDRGQEGLELAYDRQLKGVPGQTRVLRDRVGNAVEHSERVRPVVDGEDLRISLDARIQYLAYRHLKAAVKSNRARGGSVVILDARNGEVLAMVNEPGFNPNNRRDRVSKRFRNRAVTDVFEPGSTIKPFTVATALQQRVFGPDTRIDTTPGVLTIGRHRIRDTKNYGRLTVSRVIMKSSNVGAAKIALELAPQKLVHSLGGVGFGSQTALGFPGEVNGTLPSRQRWRRIEQATLSYGYGLSATTVQLARAYTVFANQGVVLPVTLIPQAGPVIGERVFDANVVLEIGAMLEMAVSDEGTGKAARLPLYSVAGKTGTVHKLVDGAYDDDRYLSVFAGYSPVTAPRLVMVAVIDDPRGEDYYGGAVAAPVFSRVISGALRLLNVAPDREPKPDTPMLAEKN